ncbi:hypothetical protein BJ138DRAFT_1014245 [Hygrophoropsis aurantiaca]|uniref:Uncharacterized protein n=1 Tax=Hygrophoropsis aurantiaca TaxID=72124 RepID=A0ACB8A2T1_9AGAM|nr:hypothetical protein BJ138DRAFT_1014245 [Hygrophoropsis aurantiaca]
MSFTSSHSHNEVQLSRSMLLDLLQDLSSRILQVFGCPIRLFIHGGAVMILHPSLSTSSTRRTTRDIDYIKRAFGHEWRKLGVYDAEDKLQSCINATAKQFHIGSDWMNADPDVALPFARDPRGNLYDPIYHDSKQQNNVTMNTVYTSPGLTLVSVTMFWGVALKLVRYKKEDPTDIVAMLQHGTKLNGVQWTPEVMETWLKTLCWPMGYSNYQSQQKEELRERIYDAVGLMQKLSSDPTYLRRPRSMDSLRHESSDPTVPSALPPPTHLPPVTHLQSPRHLHSPTHIRSPPHHNLQRSHLQSPPSRMPEPWAVPPLPVFSQPRWTHV